MLLFLNFSRKPKSEMNVNNISSDYKTVDIGVTQGTTLSPLVLILYINKIQNYIIDTSFNV